MNTRIALRTRLAVSAFAVASVATAGLVAQVARPTQTAVGAAVSAPTDNSFDQAEYQRQLSLIEKRADGFDSAEDARFGRLDPNSPAVGELTGFDLAEAKRHQRLGSD